MHSINQAKQNKQQRTLQQEMSVLIATILFPNLIVLIVYGNTSLTQQMLCGYCTTYGYQA